MTEDKKPFQEDPFAAREAEKYENPIPSREFMLEELTGQDRPLTLNQFAAAFNIEDETGLEALRRRLRAMERDGQLVRNRKGAYGDVKKMDLIRGRIIGHPDGFGFLVPEDGGDDLFLSAKCMRGVMHGDRVVARVSGVDRKGRREGAPVEVLEHVNHQIVGRFHQEYGAASVEPSNKKIALQVLIPPNFRGAALHGQIVVVDIIEQPTWRSQPIGKVVEVLGDHMAPGMEIDIAIRSYELPNEWPAEVEALAKTLTDTVPEEAIKGRIDLRDLPLVTIDGEDSRDFDDAVYCEKVGQDWKLIVAIADVSYYVEPDQALDKEAQNRGNSVYFPSNVIPMLPEELSNGLCSLNPKVDRLCMVCEMLLTATGGVKEAKFYEAVMNSSARLTYNEVAAMVVDRDETVRQQYEEILPHIDDLYTLYGVFAKKRKKRGVIEFGSTETRIIFGDDRKIDRIVPVQRNDAHKLIEEFMIAANVETARFLEEKEIPALYRVHNGPSEEKLTNLKEFLAEYGFKLGGGTSPESKHYADLLEKIRERPDSHMFETILLRSLSQAVYCPENSGHFGLAFDAYAHFTSPIRRYPDLLIHRGLKHAISGKSAKSFRYKTEDMAAFGEGCSMTERRADDATRDALDWLKAEYMQDKIGEEFDGVITAVTGFGVFVMLNEAYVEGLVHVTSFDNDYYHYDRAKQRLVGERTNKIYRLTDPLRIRVVSVNLDDKKIDFELASNTPGQKSTDRSAKKSKPGGGKKKFKGESTKGESKGRPGAKSGGKPKGKPGTKPKAKSSEKPRAKSGGGKPQNKSKVKKDAQGQSKESLPVSDQSGTGEAKSTTGKKLYKKSKEIINGIKNIWNSRRSVGS
ncbi:MAG: ribonuclease R [Gammaproteobacteria bacterium]|nr:ribonuclease R [Gammaproteobacteria bacterium]